MADPAGQRYLPGLAAQRAGLDGKTHDFYVRQLRDWKFSMDIDRMHPSGMEIYGELCALDPGPVARPVR